MRSAIAVGGYALLAVVVTHPLVWHLGTSLPGMPFGDQTQYLWCIDTFWTQLLAGASPFHTDRVLYPVGANLMHTGLAPFVSLFAWPIRTQPVLYLGLAVLVSLVLAALGMRALVARLTGNVLAGTIAGCFYAFSPVVLSLTDSSHYYKVVSAALLPWGLDALVAFLRAPRARAIVALSIVVWSLVFTDYYETVLFLILVVVVGVPSLRPSHLPLIGAALTANLALALAATRWVFPPLDTSDLMSGGATFWTHSIINLADLFVPSSANPLLGALGRFAFDRPNGDVDSYYLGCGVLVLAVLALGRQRPRETVPLTLAGVILTALACGTLVRVGTTVLLTEAKTPWFWLVRLPYLDILDLPRCFVLGTQLVLATLAGAGLARLLAVPERRRLALIGAAAIFVVEYGQVGMRLYTLTVPAVYRRLAALPERTLLEVPSGVTESKMVFGYDLSRPSNNEQMYFQTIHRKRRVGGYLSRIPRSTYRWFDSEPVIGDIFMLANPTWDRASWIWESRQRVTRLPDYPPEVVDRFLDVLDLGYVLVQPSSRQPFFAENIDRLLAGHIVSREVDTDGFVLYVLDRRGESARRSEVRIDRGAR